MNPTVVLLFAGNSAYFATAWAFFRENKILMDLAYNLCVYKQADQPFRIKRTFFLTLKEDL